MELYYYIAQFILALTLVILYYEFVEFKRVKKYTKNNIPIELKYFIKSQNIDMKKINYKKLMRIVSITNGIDIGIILLLTNLSSNFFIKALIAIVATLATIYISYNLIGFILKKKGMTKNES